MTKVNALVQTGNRAPTNHGTTSRKATAAAPPTTLTDRGIVDDEAARRARCARPARRPRGVTISTTNRTKKGRLDPRPARLGVVTYFVASAARTPMTSPPAY